MTERGASKVEKKVTGFPAQALASRGTGPGAGTLASVRTAAARPGERRPFPWHSEQTPALRPLYYRHGLWNGVRVQRMPGSCNPSRGLRDPQTVCKRLSQ